MSNFYKCHKCGSNEFTHDVTEFYEEIFDSEKETVIEEKCYVVAKVWQCKKCGAEIPEEDDQKFLLQMYDVLP